MQGLGGFLFVWLVFLFWFFKIFFCHFAFFEYKFFQNKIYSLADQACKGAEYSGCGPKVHLSPVLNSEDIISLANFSGAVDMLKVKHVTKSTAARMLSPL